MGYKLHTHNRKVNSGTKLRARIVTPNEKKAFINAEYDILIQTEKLSDKECCIRDKQTIDAILNTNNPDYTNITTAIVGLNTALSSISYSDKAVVTQWEGDRITVNGTEVQLIDSNGRVITRPPYNPKAQPGLERYREVSFTITITKNKESETLTKTFFVPNYTAQEVLDILQSNLTESKLWNAINKNNANYGWDCIQSGLKTSFTAQEVRSLFGDIIKTLVVNNDESVPSLEIDLSKLYNSNGTGMQANGSFTPITAPQAYAVSNGTSVSNYETISVSVDDYMETSSIGMAISAYRHSSLARGNGFYPVIAYLVRGKTTDLQKIIGILKYTTDQDETLTRNAEAKSEINGCAIMSVPVNPATIITNVVNPSIKGTWAGLQYYTNGQVAATTPIVTNGPGSSSSNPLVISLADDESFIVKLPASVHTLARDGLSNISDLITEKIGYSVVASTSDPVIKGFSTKCLKFRLEITTSDINMWEYNGADLTTTAGRASVDTNAAVITSQGSGVSDITNDSSTDKWLVIPNSLIDSGTSINCALHVSLNEATYGAGATNEATLYFRIVKP